MVGSAPRTLLVNECEWDADSCKEICMRDLQAMDKMRQQAKDNAATYHKRVMKAYNKAVKALQIQPENLVLKTTNFIQRKICPPSKFHPH